MSDILSDWFGGEQDNAGSNGDTPAADGNIGGQDPVFSVGAEAGSLPLGGANPTHLPFLPSSGGFGLTPMPFAPMPSPPDFHITPNPDYVGLPTDHVATYEEYQRVVESVRENGIQPIGFNDDGVPVYETMPDASRIDGAFIAPVFHCGPASPYWTYEEFPAAGEARDAFLDALGAQSRSEMQLASNLQQFESAILAERSRNAQEGIELAKLEQKEQDLRFQELEMKLAFVEKMTVDQYRTVRDMKLNRIGPEYSSDFVDPVNGDVWKVDVHGNAFRQTNL